MTFDLPPSTAADTSTVFALIAPDRRLAAVSDAFAILLGYTPAELCGRSVESITYAGDVGIDREPAERLFAGEIPSYEIAKRCEDRNGELVKIMLQVSAMCDAMGKVAYAIMQVRQIGTSASLPQYQIPQARSDEVEKIKRAMFW
jgi:PAS domain S-box-containing protein